MKDLIKSDAHSLPTLISKYEVLISKCEDIDEVKNIQNAMDACKTMFSKSKDMKKYQAACRLSNSALLRWEHLYRKVHKHGLNRHSRGNHVVTSSEVEKNTAHQAKVIREFKEKSPKLYESNADVPRNTLFKIAKSELKGNNPRAKTGDDEWFTPVGVIEAARKTLGIIDLDPASNAIANKFVKAKKIFTAKSDGLSRNWLGNVFLNPPYSQSGQKQAFIEKLACHYRDGDIKAAILVCPIDISPRWGDSIRESASAICLSKGNLKFHKGNPEDTTVIPQGLGSAIIYFGKDLKRFAKNFKSVGFVLFRAYHA